MALSADRNTTYRDGIEIEFPVKAATQIYAGSLVSVDGSTGYAEPATDAASKFFVGVAVENVLGGSSGGDKTVRVRREGVFKFAFTASITQGSVGDVFYIVDDETLHTTSSHLVVAGRLVKYESATVGWLDISLGTYLSSTAAASVSVADSGSFTNAATVEAALAEIYQDLLSTQRFIPLSLTQLREVATGAVGNTAANGGVLASDTTPIFEPINGATDGCQRLRWAASNNDVVMFQIALPPDLDDTKDLVLHARIASGGTTNAVGFTVDSWFNEADTKVSDSTDTNQTTSYAEVTATIAAADVPSGAQILTVMLTPVAHTTDTMLLTGLWLEYQRKILTS